MSEELDVPTADMLEIVAGGGNGVEYVNLPWLLESAAKELRTVIRERDEARAEAKKAKQDYDDLYELDEQTWVVEAEARGYWRGVQDAAKVAGSHDGCCEDFADCGYCTKAHILALLEHTGDTNSPNLER